MGILRRAVAKPVGCQQLVCSGTLVFARASDWLPIDNHNKNRGRTSRHVVFDQYSVELFDAAMKEQTGVGKSKIRFDELLVMMA